MDYGVLLSEFERRSATEIAARTSKQHRLYACLRAAILGGKIGEGTRLLASRALAEELGISRNSVLYAYERLASEGFVVGERQGTVVARVGLRHEPPTPLGDVPALSRRVADIERLAAERDGGASRPLPFTSGMPALDEFPLAQWRRCLERAWRNAGPAQLGYVGAEGNFPLRRTIAEYLRISRGVRCDPQQVFITNGTQGSLDLCARMLADAGDTVWIENPGYLGARAAFQAADLRLVPIPVDAEGLAPQPEHWRDASPRLIYITPSHQYPLGAVMSLERRLALVQQARACGAWIVEDDYDSEFRHQGAPLSALQGLTADAPVIYLGTFSKVMFPGLRMAFMVVPPVLVRVLRRVTDRLALKGRAVEQLALADFIDSGLFTRHLRRMRKLYAERRAVLEAALQRHLHGVLTVSGGAGGMHLSARLDAPVTDIAVSRTARSHGLVLPPLSPFCLAGTDDGTYNGFVLGYGAARGEQMDLLVQRMARAIEETVATQ